MSHPDAPGPDAVQLALYTERDQQPWIVDALNNANAAIAVVEGPEHRWLYTNVSFPRFSGVFGRTGGSSRSASRVVSAQLPPSTRTPTRGLWRIAQLNRNIAFDDEHAGAELLVAASPILW